MASRPGAWRNILRRQPSSPRKTSTISHISLPLEIPVEEETLPYYEPEHYYPVHIGEVYESRYQITGRLGYGAYSTSWLCRDLQCVAPLCATPMTPRNKSLVGINIIEY